MAREDEEDLGTPGSVTSETGWKLIMLLRLESHKTAMSGGSWSLKSPMDMEHMIDLLKKVCLFQGISSQYVSQLAK